VKDPEKPLDNRREIRYNKTEEKERKETTMKKLTAIAFVLIALFGTATAEIYPETAKVVEVDYENDLVTVETFCGFLFAFEGCEDWYIGDCASLIMEDNGTESVKDDEIIMAQYSAWELVNWQYCED